jgi:hypothetical protein
MSERKHLHFWRLVWRNGNDNGNGTGIATVGYWVSARPNGYSLRLYVCRSVSECDGGSSMNTTSFFSLLLRP